MKEDAEKAKHELFDDLNKMSIRDVNMGKVKMEEEHPRARKFNVCNPIKINGHIKYTIKGEDNEGPFEEVRRYKEFYSLRNTLNQRWPGVYIPAIPEKKLVVCLRFPILHLFRVTKMTILLKKEGVC